MSSTDWTTFNTKQSALTNPVTGTGTSGYVPKFNGTTTLTNSSIQDSGSTITLGVTTLSNGTIYTSAGNAISAGGNSFAIAASSTRGVININGSTDQFLTFSSNGYILGSSTLFRILSTPDFDIVVGGSQRLLISSSTGDISLPNSTAKIIGGDSAGRLVLANSTQSTYGIFYGATNATPNITSFVNNSALTLTLNANNTATFSSSVTATQFSGTNYPYQFEGIGAADASYAHIGAGSTAGYVTGIYTYGGGYATPNLITFTTASVNRISILANGNTIINNGTTDNGSGGVLQANGMITASSLSASGTTYAASATVGAFYYHVINGGSGVNLTLLSPSNNNRQYVFVNTTANTVTITAATSTNIINLTSSSVSSITLLANQRAFLIADGNNKYYQIF